MGKKSTVIPVALILLAALSWWVLLSKRHSLSQAYEMALVLVARYDLPANTTLKEDLVEIRQLPRTYMQQDVYEVRGPADIKLVKNLVTAIRIPKGNQITYSAMLSPGTNVQVPAEEPKVNTPKPLLQRIKDMIPL